MVKNDKRAMYRLTLDCGHERMGAATSQTKRCQECRTMQRVVGVGDLMRPEGGRLAKRQSRSDGLVVLHFSDVERKLWWCSICHGKSPHKAHLRMASSMDDLLPAWDQHTSNADHSANASAHFLVLDIADAINRSSSGE